MKGYEESRNKTNKALFISAGAFGLLALLLLLWFSKFNGDKMPFEFTLKYKKSKNGLVYKIAKKGKGSRPKDGMYVTYELSCRKAKKTDYLFNTKL